MESIYYVISWLCHRTCRHCYEDRFRPYYGADLSSVVNESRENAPRIIENFPSAMSFIDADVGIRKPGRIILAGGEVLLDPIREPVLYPAIEQLRRKYPPELRIIIQTTGDIVIERHVRELKERGLSLISVSGMDDFHDGIDCERQRNKLTAMFEKAGMPYSFFGATPDAWIGKIWPRGRALENELSTATLADNFCNQWSGGLNFLAYGQKGSEVSIEPNGNVYPCCMKTRAPIGNLLERPLIDIIESHKGNPVYRAISAGQPQRMGLTHGWSVEKFLEKSRVTLPSGRVYENLCVGCDRFHDEVLAAQPLVQLGT